MKRLLIPSIIILIILTVLVLAGVAPSGAGGPTAELKQATIDALNEISEAIASIPVIDEQREGFCKSFEVPHDSNTVVFTVPEGQRFVLRKLYAYIPTDYKNDLTDWLLVRNDKVFIDGKISVFGTDVEANIYHDWGFVHRCVHEFPDKCVVVNSGQTLKAFNTCQHTYPFYMTIIGYFCEVEQ